MTDPEPTISNPQRIDQKLIINSNDEDLAGVSEITEIHANVYPNPTSGSATIQWEFNETMKLSILDARGALVEYQELLPGMDRTEINLLESGVYFLRITKDNQQVWFEKLIKL